MVPPSNRLEKLKGDLKEFRRCTTNQGACEPPEIVPDFEENIASARR
jgi:hypothetical protein